jgi:DNA-nicking Smr family endonuclease
VSKKKGKGGREQAAPVQKEKPFFRPFEAVAKEQKAKLAEAPVKASGPSRAAPRPAAAVRPAGGKGKPPPPEPSFAELLYGVKPIDRGPRSIPELEGTAPQPRAYPPEDDSDVRAHLRALVEGGSARFEISDDGQRIEGKRIDVDAKVFRRLRRGELAPESTCDLHGLSVLDARARLEEFLAKSHARGDRTLLVVHGKGEHSPRGVGVLRGEMAAWLSQGTASVHVAAFATAVPDDGGEGAMYVLLQR